MSEATNWGPGLWALGLAALIAVVFLVLSRRSKVGEVRPGTVDDLSVRYERALAELRDHTANRHLLPAEEWEKEKARLEQAAAQILRERDGLKHEEHKAEVRAEKRADAAAKDSSFLAQNPALKGLLIAAAVVGFFIFLGVQLSESSTTRADGMSVTGGTRPGMGGAAQAPEDPELSARFAAVRRNPDDVDALAEMAMYLIGQQEFGAARAYAVRASAIDPYDVRGRIARALLRAVDGQAKPAMDELEHLADTYPEAWEARFYAGLIAREEKDPARALKQFDAYLVQAPPEEQPPAVTQLMAELRAELGSAAPPPPQAPPATP